MLHRSGQFLTYRGGVVPAVQHTQGENRAVNLGFRNPAASKPKACFAFQTEAICEASHCPGITRKGGNAKAEAVAVTSGEQIVGTEQHPQCAANSRPSIMAGSPQTSSFIR